MAYSCSPLIKLQPPPVASPCLDHDRCSKHNEGILETSKAIDPGSERETTFEEEAQAHEEQHRHGTIFILDSGAPIHVTGNVALFSELAAGNMTTYHLARNGRNLPVAGTGTVACNKYRLSGVLYVPGLGAGVALVSVQQLAERGYRVVFGGGRCYVKDPNSGSIVGEGRLHDKDGMYRLQFLRVCTNGNAGAATDDNPAA